MPSEDVHSATVTAALNDRSLTDPTLYLDRELSLLAFQRRVLYEAHDGSNKLLERVKFLSILFSNLDEFYMVRIAVLNQQMKAPAAELAIERGAATEQLDRLRAEVNQILGEAYDTWLHELVPALESAGIAVKPYADLEPEDRTALSTYFHRSIFPVLTPLAFDPGRPFPHISNLSLNLAVAVRDKTGVERFARVKVPDSLPQLITVPSSQTGMVQLVWLEEVIIDNLSALFPGLEIMECHPFHVTRDAEVAIKELESDDLLETIEEAVWQRRFRSVVRMQVDRKISEHILQILSENMDLDPRDVYRVDGPLDLSRLRQLGSLERPDLKDAPFVPFLPPELSPRSDEDILALIRREDELLHHPYDSFQPIIEFLRRAANDSDTMAIKMTLYRVGRNSPVVEQLVSAIENGKQVAVLVELKARFDEESNIEWARALESEGVHVVYGLVGLKVHSKVAMIVRREGDSIRRYIHLGTGNYNPATARLYTDLSFFTTDDQIGADVTDLFNYLTGYSAKKDFRKLLVAPINLRQRMEGLIRREIELHRTGQQGRLVFKMNALEDPGMIRLLYEAAQAGVQIELIVRGICCLRPGLKGISENIRVTSIVGRFLEHSRIYYFGNGGNPEVYLGSADLMPRNLDHRIEIIFPVESPKLVRRIEDEILSVSLADNVKARWMDMDGVYHRKEAIAGMPKVDSQASFLSRKWISPSVRKNGFKSAQARL